MASTEMEIVPYFGRREKVDFVTFVTSNERRISDFHNSPEMQRGSETPSLIKSGSPVENVALKMRRDLPVRPMTSTTSNP